MKNRSVTTALAHQLAAADAAIERLRAALAEDGAADDWIELAMADVARAIARSRRLHRQAGDHIEDAARQVALILAEFDGRRGMSAKTEHRSCLSTSSERVI